MTPARHYSAEIQLLLDGRLDVSLHGEVESHLTECAECRREFAALQWTKQMATTQNAEVAAPDWLRENILSAVQTEMPAAPVRAGKPFKFPTALALAASVILLGLLAALFVFRSPTLLQTVERDFRDHQRQRLALELNTGDVTEMESFFKTHGVTFDTRVFDLGMMNYQLVGGRVQNARKNPAALFVYRGPDGRLLHCRMYAGALTELPATADVRAHNGFNFHVYQHDGVTMVFWQEGTVVCALASDIPAEDVVQLAFAKAMLPAPKL